MTTLRIRQLAEGRGGLVTVLTVLGLLVGIGATIFGLGAANNAIANYDASSWLWSNNPEYRPLFTKDRRHFP